MTFLYPFVFLLFIPLFILYKSDNFNESRYTKREKKFLYLSVTFALLALSRPVLLDTTNKQKFDAQEFVIAIDVSLSMQGTDLQPTRYIVAKQTLKQIVQALPQNRFSIFAFTTNAILISPPTTDTEISLIALDSLEPQYILTKGTSLTKLLNTISKISYEEKNLIIISDGGEEYNLDTLVKISKKNKIIPFVVATGTINGAILMNDNKNLKDERNNLVISRVNPILKDFAKLSGGKYYQLNSSNTAISKQIVSDINELKKKRQKTEINVLKSKELFPFVLLLSILTFIMSVTKIYQFFVFVLLFFLPNHAHSAILDFYHIQNAKIAYQEQNYKKSIEEFEQVQPSVKSYYNVAVSSYKAGQYKKAVEIFSSIQTTDTLLKQKIYYNMGNCAVKMKKYERAKIYYINALNLGYDVDSFYNLSLIYSLSLKEKTYASDIFPKNKINKKTGASKQKNVKKSDKKNSKNSSSNSNQKAGENSNVSSNSTKKQDAQNLKKTDKTIPLKYKTGYKAYELINKGYTNEIHPW